MTVEYRGKVRARAGVLDPGTSWDAAAKQTTRKVDLIKVTILSLLATYGPLTDEQLVDQYEAYAFMHPQVQKVTPQSIRTRRKALADEGRAITSGYGVTRLGNRAVRWTVRITESDGDRASTRPPS